MGVDQSSTPNNSVGGFQSPGIPAMSESLTALDVSSRTRSAKVDLGWGASVAVDASAGNYFALSGTSNIAATIAVPTNAPVALSQRITFEIRNNSGGAFGTQPAFAGGAGGFVTLGALPAIANNQRYTISFVYNPSLNSWVQDGAPSAAG